MPSEHRQGFTTLTLALAIAMVLGGFLYLNLGATGESTYHYPRVQAPPGYSRRMPTLDDPARTPEPGRPRTRPTVPLGPFQLGRTTMEEATTLMGGRGLDMGGLGWLYRNPDSGAAVVLMPDRRQVLVGAHLLGPDSEWMEYLAEHATPTRLDPSSWHWGPVRLGAPVAQARMNLGKPSAWDDLAWDLPEAWVVLEAPGGFVQGYWILAGPGGRTR